ncbi:hypothetical protein DFH09DRAFT_1072529 [Mycena vulgaris]|nr:hypothetical protein DFH09DRAFT_1072529 [Mycena vulgaris]
MIKFSFLYVAIAVAVVQVMAGQAPCDDAKFKYPGCCKKVGMENGKPVLDCNSNKPGSSNSCPPNLVDSCCRHILTKKPQGNSKQECTPAKPRHIPGFKGTCVNTDYQKCAAYTDDAKAAIPLIHRSGDPTFTYQCQRAPPLPLIPGMAPNDCPQDNITWYEECCSYDLSALRATLFAVPQQVVEGTSAFTAAVRSFQSDAGACSPLTQPTHFVCPTPSAEQCCHFQIDGNATTSNCVGRDKVTGGCKHPQVESCCKPADPITGMTDCTLPTSDCVNKYDACCANGDLNQCRPASDVWPNFSASIIKPAEGFNLRDKKNINKSPGAFDTP